MSAPLCGPVLRGAAQLDAAAKSVLQQASPGCHCLSTRRSDRDACANYDHHVTVNGRRAQSADQPWLIRAFLPPTAHGATLTVAGRSSPMTGFKADRASRNRALSEIRALARPIPPPVL